MSIKTRTLVFATFLISCIVVGLLLSSLLTDHWIEAEAKKEENQSATGTLHFGLFSGKKELNSGLGGRSFKIDIPATLRSEPNLMNYWLWLGTSVGTALGLFSSIISGIASVLKSASDGKKNGTMLLLFVSNAASILSQAQAFLCWLVEFIFYLKENVLPREDIERSWHTKELSKLGHSFYFLIVGILFVIINLVILVVVAVIEKKERKPIQRQEPTIDEKMTGAIMLY